MNFNVLLGKYIVHPSVKKDFDNIKMHGTTKKKMFLHFFETPFPCLLLSKLRAKVVMFLIAPRPICQGLDAIHLTNLCHFMNTAISCYDLNRGYCVAVFNFALTASVKCMPHYNERISSIL